VLRKCVTDISGQFFDVVRIAVEILDVNDHCPSFDDQWSVSGVTLNVSELVQRGSAFRLPAAVDADSGKFGVQGYRLTDSDHPDGGPDLPFDLVFESRSVCS